MPIALPFSLIHGDLGEVPAESIPLRDIRIRIGEIQTFTLPRPLCDWQKNAATRRERVAYNTVSSDSIETYATFQAITLKGPPLKTVPKVFKSNNISANQQVRH